MWGTRRDTTGKRQSSIRALSTSKELLVSSLLPSTISLLKPQELSHKNSINRRLLLHMPTLKARKCKKAACTTQTNPQGTPKSQDCMFSITARENRAGRFSPSTFAEEQV